MILHASCHCGSVRLEILRRPRSLTECNCSICGRYGARWAYYTRRSVRILAPPDALTSYSYGPKTFLYHHCRRCGCVTHYTRINTARDDRIAVNARMMDPDEIASLPIRFLDVRRPKRGARRPNPATPRQRRPASPRR